MTISRAASDLLPLLYAAASGEGEWTGFIGSLCEATQAKIAHIIYLNNSTRPTELNPTANATRQWIKQVGMSDAMLAELAGYGEMDGWLKACVYGPYREGWAGLGSELWPVDDMLRTEYYRAMMQKHDIVWLAAAILLKRPGEIAACGLLRGKTQSNFDDCALHLLRELTPHMQTAIRLYNRTGELQQNLDSLELALEQFATGVLVLDNTSAVIFANSIAQRQLSLKDGLVIEGGKIKTTNPRDSAHLEATIQEAIRASDSAAAKHSGERNIGVAPIRRKQGPALHAFVTPWLSDGQLALVKPAAVVLVSQPERKIPREAWLESLYGLTRAESKLAVLIAGGMDGPEAASQLGLSPETVRTRLKTVFSKTNTRRQSDLARLLASLPQG